MLSFPAKAVEGEAGVHSNVTVRGSILEPRKLEAAEATVKARVRLPRGFSLSVFARELVNPRVLAVSEAGHVYVSRRAENDVLLLKDTDGDGRADEKISVASRPGLHGIAITGSTMFLVANKDLYRAEIQQDGKLGELTRLIRDLPDAGQHRTRTIGVGPDGKLYVSVGSTCNECEESNPENATILKISQDGKMRTIFASGLRNTIGFAWHPSTGELFGMDHGIDWLGDNEQREELNHIRQGRQYGWPFIYDDGRVNPQSNPPGAMTAETWREISEKPVLSYTAHAAPVQMLFYTGGAVSGGISGRCFCRHARFMEPPSAERL
jgi:glucose/arabinose dehydrogenase